MSSGSGSDARVVTQTYTTSYPVTVVSTSYATVTTSYPVTTTQVSTQPGSQSYYDRTSNFELTVDRLNCNGNNHILRHHCRYLYTGLYRPWLDRDCHKLSDCDDQLSLHYNSDYHSAWYLSPPVTVRYKRQVIHD